MSINVKTPHRICPHSFGTEDKRESHKDVCENKKFCNVSMPSEDTKTLEYNQ